MGHRPDLTQVWLADPCYMEIERGGHVGGVMQLSCILAAGVVDEPIDASEFTITSLLKTFPRHLLRQTPNPLSFTQPLGPCFILQTRLFPATLLAQTWRKKGCLHFLRCVLLCPGCPLCPEHFPSIMSPPQHLQSLIFWFQSQVWNQNTGSTRIIF